MPLGRVALWSAWHRGFRGNLLRLNLLGERGVPSLGGVIQLNYFQSLVLLIHREVGLPGAAVAGVTNGVTGGRGGLS